MYGKIKKSYTSTGKYDNQQQYKAILEVALVSTSNGFTDNSPISPGTSLTIRKPSAIKPLHIFTEVLDVKKKTAFRQVGDAKNYIS